MEARGPGHPQLHSYTGAGLSYTNPYLYNEENGQWEWPRVADEWKAGYNA